MIGTRDLTLTKGALTAGAAAHRFVIHQPFYICKFRVRKPTRRRVSVSRFSAAVSASKGE